MVICEEGLSKAPALPLAFGLNLFNFGPTSANILDTIKSVSFNISLFEAFATAEFKILSISLAGGVPISCNCIFASVTLLYRIKFITRLTLYVE